MTSQWARWRFKSLPHDCLLNRLFRRRSRKTSELRVTGLCVSSPHKWPVTRKMSPFDDGIMITTIRRLIKSSQLQLLFYIMIRIHYQHYIFFVGRIHHQSLVASSHKAPLMQDFDVFFIVNLNKLLKKQSSYFRFGTLLSWYRHQMETFSTLLALCERNPPVTGGFPSQWPVARTFDAS